MGRKADGKGDDNNVQQEGAMTLASFRRREFRWWEKGGEDTLLQRAPPSQVYFAAPTTLRALRRLQIGCPPALSLSGVLSSTPCLATPTSPYPSLSP
ncbi:hypothetical protein TIFTF001_037076 [Ficus carica]|uniref:Uncharacterized protein n=1 Tax=Ficus carica TaxID=3494 RepID=A0AA88JBI0_FICCA|nr:hypothetical protein TIFTF001_037076 [Ficus carica]